MLPRLHSRCCCSHRSRQWQRTLFHCHIEPHLTAGMQTRFTVEPSITAAGSVRNPR